MAIGPRSRGTDLRFAGCCYSSGVEHSLGKGEAESSNLSSSTINPPDFQAVARSTTPHSPAAIGRTKQDFPVQSGGNLGDTFSDRSDADKRNQAAEWLLDHRDECSGRIIPTLKARFCLSTCEAISAAQLSHALQYGEARCV